MVEEAYCSFETAKLLKEKGFNEIPVYTYYLSYGGFYLSPMAVTNKDLYAHGHIAAPTLQMAMKWLREIHKLDIDVSIEYKNSKKVYYYSVLKKTVIRDIDCLHSETNFDSYEQAAEAAIKYCLESLV